MYAFVGDDDLVEGEDALGFHAEAAPIFGDDDAVSGVAGVVADLDGLVDAVAGSAFGEKGDVLRAVVGDAGDAVAVEQEVGRGTDAFGAVVGAGVDDAAVGDAAVEGEVLTSAAFELDGRGATAADVKPGGTARSGDARGDSGGDARVRRDAGLLEQSGNMGEKRGHGGTLSA